MKNLIVSVLFLITNATAMAANTASYMKCNGTDTAGQSVYLIAYPNSSTVNINGDIINIAGKTRNGQGVVTQNFLSVYGVLVYDSLVPINDKSLTIYQFNAVTDALLAQAWLTCSFYGNAGVKPSVFDHQFFNAINSTVLKMTDGMPYNKIKQSDNQTSTLSSSPIDACIAKIDNAISAAINKAASQGLLCSSVDIENRMKLAMSKGSCYGSIDKAQLCKIQLDAMVASSGGCGFSNAFLMNNAKRISGC